MNKKRITFCMLLLLILTTFISMLTSCTASKVNPIPSPTITKNIFIYDEDKTINDNVEENLNNIIVELEEKTNIEFVVISVESLLNYSIKDYSNNLINTLNIGQKDNRILLLFSRKDHKVRLEVGKNLKELLPTSKRKQILNTYFVPYSKKNEYSKGTSLTVRAIIKIIADDYNVHIQGLENSLEDTINTKSDLIIRCIICIVSLTMLAIVHLLTSRLD